MKTHPAGKLCQFTLDLSLTGSAHAQTYVRGHGYFRQMMVATPMVGHRGQRLGGALSR